MRRFAALIGFLCLAGAAFAAIDASVILYLPFDEGSGATTADLSASKTNGTLQKSPKWVDGKFGKALEFDGKTNFVQVEQDVNSHADKGEISLCAWVKILATATDAHGQNRAPVIMKGNANMWEFGLLVYDDYAAGMSFWTCPGNGISEVGAGANSLKKNEWQSFCGTFKVTGASRIYVDGKMVKEDTARAAGEICKTGTRPVIIGSREDGQFLNAAIDEVRIYNRELSAAEVAAQMANPLTTGGTAVESQGKLAATWAVLKTM